MASWRNQIALVHMHVCIIYCTHDHICSIPWVLMWSLKLTILEATFMPNDSYTPSPFLQTTATVISGQFNPDLGIKERHTIVRRESNAIQRHVFWSGIAAISIQWIPPKLKPKLRFIHSNNIFHLPVSASHLFKRSFSSGIRAIDVEVPERENLWSFPAPPTFPGKVPLTASPHSQY